MNFIKILLMVASSIIGASCFPQSASELARGVKHAEDLYYNMEAPELIPYDNPQDIDNAKLETEGYGSKIDATYFGVQKKTSDIFNRQTAVEGIKESEKYGNNAESLSGLFKVTTSALSVVSNAVNAVLDAPGKAIQSFMLSSNNALNKIGGKIVGLQK